MKKYLFVLFLAVFQGMLFAQWISVNPYPTLNTTYIGSAPGPNTYVTVTGQGEAVFTHDGGTSWNVMPLPLDGIYRSTFFLDDNLGWVAGAVGSGQVRIFKTTNGGASWVQQPNCADTTKYDIFFIDQNTGWTVGFNGMIYKTTDGGNNWFSQSNTAVSNKTLYGVFATDVNNAYIVGNTDAILKTTDGGASWNLLPVIFSTATDYRGAYFPPTGTGLTGFVVGNRNRIAKTTDGGATWQQVYNPGGTNQLWAVDFNANGIGLASGATSTLLRTTDFGNTWTPVSGFPNTSIIFYSVRFGDNNTAYLSGSNGYFFKSTDAGATWTELGYRFTTTSLKDVSFADDNTGFAVGISYIAKTTNGGMTWTPQTSPYTGDINKVVAMSPSAAIAGCDGGNIIRTTDGGANWTLIQTGITGTNSDLLAIDFIDNNNGMAVAYNGTAAKTTDGGLTWTMLSPITSGNPWDMDMVDTLNAFVACTGEKIYATTDGGQSWTLQLSVGGLGTYGISALNKDVAVAGGTSGNTYYTTNGGNTWNIPVTKPANTVWGICIKSPTLAFAACASGYVYRSTDGGANWTQEPRLTINTLEDIDITPAGNAFAVGSGGIVMKYKAQQTNCTDIAIQAGWNILSVPRLAANRAASVLFPNKTSPAFSYANGYAANDTLDYGRGYWIRFPSAGTVTLCGNATGLTTIPISQGWNIFGVYERIVRSPFLTTVPPNIITSAFFAYNNGYVYSDTLLPGKGYWIRASQNGVIRIPAGLAPLNSLPASPLFAPDSPTLTIEDNSGYRQMLYLISPSEQPAALPPPPPAGIPDVRFASGNFAEQANGSGNVIQLQKGAGNFSMLCLNADLAIAELPDGAPLFLRAGRRFEVPSNVNALRVTLAESSPMEYRLSQNYPNPFNPVTTIQYSIGSRQSSVNSLQSVSLKVYDVLGREVATLINGQKPAGRYTVSFNASLLPSGTYFYELRAGDYGAVRKMVVLK